MWSLNFETFRSAQLVYDEIFWSFYGWYVDMREFLYDIKFVKFWKYRIPIESLERQCRYAVSFNLEWIVSHISHALYLQVQNRLN